MRMKLAVSLIAAFCIAIINSSSSTEEESQSSCSSSSRDDLTWPLSDDDLFRTITVSDDGAAISGSLSERTLTVEKLSSRPPIFRVKNFLTEDECLMLRRLAVEEGLEPGVVDSDDGLLNSSSNGGKKKKMGIFDTNNDGRLSVYELIRMIDDFFESHVSEDDILTMLSLMGVSLDEQQNNTISIQDFIHSNTAAMRKYFSNMMKENPSKRSRYSEMAWLTTTTTNTMQSDDDGRHELMKSIRKRVATLTKLPEYVVHAHMPMQVVHYEPPSGSDDNGGGGHYTAHFDSLPIQEQLPCCHIQRTPCRPCRMATVLYSLSNNNGGYTAFPFADHEQQQTAETVEEWRMSSASRESSYCATDGPGLRVPPELGQAILWYNHDIQHLVGGGVEGSDDDDSHIPPLLGPLDRSTIHAGCSMTTDHHHGSQQQQDGKTLPWNAPGKWIANHWIEASNVAGEDEAHYASMIAQGAQ